MWSGFIKYETRYRDCDDERYLVGWRNAEFFIVPPEERSKFYLRVPDWWMQYERNRILLVPKSSVFSYALRVLIDAFLGLKVLYRFALSDQ